MLKLPSNSQEGITLLELLLSISIIIVLFSFAVPVYQFFVVRNDLDVSVDTIVQTFRRAIILSESVDSDTSWGVKIQSGSITLFQGASYAARNTSFDEAYDMASTITPSGITEIVFAKFTGAPSLNGTTTLTSSNNETRTITINEKGMVDY